ncbi:glycerophosphodiester phosphodiesterase family protein [Enterococcus faecalis 13-SD-W-01]|nr:glycerophosphodiester phosphodiesterase family protein [Enterococcus faecalis 13-SD-W-01]
MKKIVELVGLTAIVFLFSACTGKQEQVQGFNWLKNEETILSAHRGAHTAAPENTLEAMEAAIDMNYGAVEIDPRMSSDGKIYLMHDDTVDRTTDGTGPLEKMPSKQIDNLKIEPTDYPKFSNKTVKVPTFDEAVKVTSKSDLILNVDGSKGDWTDEEFVDNIVNTVKSHDMFEKTFFVLSDEKEREFFNKLYPEACVSWLFDSSSTIEKEIEKAKAYKHAMLSVSNDFATKEVIEKLNKSKVYYQVYSVNNQDRYDELKSWHAKMIETDTITP